MANLKPWYKVVTPREDLRESKPLDASEFAFIWTRSGTGERLRSTGIPTSSWIGPI